MDDTNAAPVPGEADGAIPRGFFGRLLAALVGRPGVFRAIAADGSAWQGVILWAGISVIVAVPLAGATAWAGPGAAALAAEVGAGLGLTLTWAAISFPICLLDVWAVWIVTRRRGAGAGYWGWFSALAFGSAPLLVGAGIQHAAGWVATELWCLVLWVRAAKELAERSTLQCLLRVVAGVTFAWLVIVAAGMGALIALLGMAGG